MRPAYIALAAAAAFFGHVAGASAGPITVGQWYTFGFGTTGSALSSSCLTTCENGIHPPSIALPSDSPWTFTLPTGGEFIVTDAFMPGDQFSLFDHGTSIGDTSTPVIDHESSCFNDISACLAFSEISKGTFALTAGDHAITGTVIQSPFDGGVGYFQVRAVPEPATMSLLAASLVALGMISYRRRARRLF